MKEIIVKANDVNQRLDRFMIKILPRVPKNTIYRYIRTKRIKVNHKKTTEDYNLLLDDHIQLYINDELLETNFKNDFMYASNQFFIIYEDNNLILVDKKPGVIVHEDNTQVIDTLINQIKLYLYHKKAWDPNQENSFVPALCNRLDRNTGGIVIAAKNAQTLKIINEKLKNHEIIKLYLALIFGKINPQAGELNHYLFKDAQANKVYISDTKTSSNKEITTQYKTLKFNHKYSLLEVNLITGRTHQIRAHLAYINHPIVGDRKYAQKEFDDTYNKQALYAYKIIFNFKTDAGILNYLKDKTFSVNQNWFSDLIK